MYISARAFKWVCRNILDLNENLLAKIGFETAENEPACPLSVYGSPRFDYAYSATSYVYTNIVCVRSLFNDMFVKPSADVLFVSTYLFSNSKLERIFSNVYFFVLLKLSNTIFKNSSIFVSKAQEIWESRRFWSSSVKIAEIPENFHENSWILGNVFKKTAKYWK